ncbi:MAG: hypothetical protein EOO02_15630 [Chitinophagaceae bacterium]|nr:MAG: hypothetical protein EOO02_15630 [Chitinophagaceae bacterium]
MLHYFHSSLRKTFTAAVVILSTSFALIAHPAGSDTKIMESFTIKSVPSINGSYTVSPAIPADGKVAAGTELTIKAKPSAGYSLDAIFYTVKGGMWGTTSFENFTTEYKIKVEKDLTLGATFIPSSLVNNLVVKHDIVYAKPWY